MADFMAKPSHPTTQVGSIIEISRTDPEEWFADQTAQVVFRDHDDPSLQGFDAFTPGTCRVSTIVSTE
jgi:hypothetical protein